MDSDKILQALIKSGKLTDLDIVEVAGADAALLELTDVVHMLFSDGRESTLYHKASQQPDRHKDPTTREWINRTVRLKNYLNYESVTSMQAAIGTAVTLFRKTPPLTIKLMSLLQDREEFYRITDPRGGETSSMLVQLAPEPLSEPSQTQSSPG